jgi:quinol---cytochrome-c reductase cytochrome c subunit
VRPSEDRTAPRTVSYAIVLATPWLIGAIVFVSARGSDAREQATPSADRARTIFLADCAVCHGSRGLGTANGPSLQGVGAAAIDYWVSTGRMPLPQNHHGTRIDRHEPKYSHAEIEVLVAYVAQLTGGGPAIPHVAPDGDPGVGGVLYRLNCAACHSWAGTGGALEDREAPNLFAATPTQIAEAVRTGPDAMPAFGEAAISGRQLSDVVAYIQRLDHPNDRGGAALGHAGPLAEGAVAIVLGLGALLIATRLIGTRT